MPIFDQGYQHWQGTLSGHGWRWLAVARHGVRTQLQNRSVRMLLMVAWLPALGLVGLLTLWGLAEQQSGTAIGLLAPFLPAEVLANPAEFRSVVWTVGYTYFFQAALWCAVFLVLLVGPNLVSRDLRFNALPLYLSRPVRRVDYFVGKLGVIGYFLAATVVLPAVGAYLLGLAFSLDLGVVRDTYRTLFAGVGFGLVVAVSAGTLILALSSLSRRSVYVGLAWAALVLLTNTAAGILSNIQASADRREVVGEAMDRWVRDHPPPPGITFVDEGSPAYPTPPGGRPPTPEELAQRKYQQDWQTARRREFGKARAAVEARQAGDWRPLVSYTTNLKRVGDALLGAQAARERWAEVQARARGLVSGPDPDETPAAPPAPWHLSAVILAGVWAASVFILSRRVKSLDRLK